MKQNEVDSRVWHIDFRGEGSIDAGGPSRESLSNITMEVQSALLPLMI